MKPYHQISSEGETKTVEKTFHLYKVGVWLGDDDKRCINMKGKETWGDYSENMNVIIYWQSLPAALV